MSTATSTSLLDRVRDLEPDAWWRFVALFGPEVYRWCRQAALSPEQAALVGQDLFQGLSGRLAEFRRNPGDRSFPAWLHGLTLERIEAFRRADPAETAVGDSRLTPEAESALTETKSLSTQADGEFSPALLHRALDLVRLDLEERTWRAFWGRAVEQLPAEQVGRQLGISPNDVYVAQARVLGRLRTELGDLIA